VASAVRQTGKHLREQQNETVAQYVEKAAEQLESFSNALREKDVNELLQDAQRMARSRPALFVGGSFAAGLLMARFLKSSRENETGEYGRAGSRTVSNMQGSELPGAY
jgi:predicted alpha/beta-fold hydrolase